MSHDHVNIQAYAGVVYFLLFFGVLAIVWYYAEPGFPWHSYITLIIGYYASFGILLLVPIDIAAVIIDRRSSLQPNQNDDPTYTKDMTALSTAYQVFFTIVLIMGSVVLVFEEYYNTDGKC